MQWTGVVSLPVVRKAAVGMRRKIGVAVTVRETVMKRWRRITIWRNAWKVSWHSWMEGGLLWSTFHLYQFPPCVTNDPIL
jgi:hypothetical protein